MGKVRWCIVCVCVGGGGGTAEMSTRCTLLTSCISLLCW